MQLNKIQELLSHKAELESRLKLIPYDGTPEIKTNSHGKYLYIRKRVLGKLSSQYIDKYSEELHQLLLKNTKEARELKKEIRKVESELAKLGYQTGELSNKVALNLDFARVNMKANIYDQAVLEGVATTYPQTETIIENGMVSGMTASDVQKILNLKHAWEFILDKDVLQAKSDLYILSYIAKLVNEGFYLDGGRIRAVPVKIGGSSYVPPIPISSVIEENISQIVASKKEDIDIAIDLCLYIMKTQVFNDGNKRAAVIFANHYLISKGEGLIVIPEADVPEFKKMLVAFYEGKNTTAIKKFMKEKCWKRIE